MGNLAFVGSHSINGVSALHTELMKETVFADLHRLYPDRINNKTNGITPRRWLIQCNPGLTDLAREAIGDAFLDDVNALSRTSTRLADDAAFREKFAGGEARQQGAAGQRSSADGSASGSIPSALFDIQIKRIHEYKRQLLNIIEAVALYDQIRSHPERDWMPRVKFFGGKAAPSYHNAKLIIKLANDVAKVINRDPGGARPAQGGLHAELQCQPGRDHDAGGRPVRADFDRRHGSVGHRQHEVRAERRADHRHARRRQCRDQGTCRRRQHLHLRPDRRRGRRTPRQTATSRAR